MSQPTLEQLQTMLHEGRYHALIDALEDSAGVEAIPPLELATLRGELAMVGRAPLPDLILAARAHQAASSPLQARFAQAAVRELEAIGAHTLVEALESAVTDATPPTLNEHQQSLELSRQAAAARRTKRFAQAAQRSQEAAALRSKADNAVQLALDAAIDAWAAAALQPSPEATTAALQELRKVRDDDSAPDALRRRARELLDRIEAPSQTPQSTPNAQWQFAERPLTLAFPSPLPATASHLRTALLEAGYQVRRCRTDDELLRRLLTLPALAIILEEEQASRIGFCQLLGLESQSELLLLGESESETALLRPLREQARRSAFSGRGALLVWAGDSGERGPELSALGIEDDPSLSAVDRSYFDPAAPNVPHAHVAQLARQAIAAAPDIPAGHARLGEALLGLLRQDRLEEERQDLQRWFAQCRVRFPDAEWPHQLHAQALEHQGRWAEAFIAWCDATALDPEDWRNLLGQIRSARREGGLGSARRLMRKLLAQHPELSQLYAWLATEELELEHVEAAAVAAELAGALTPHDLDSLSVRASLAERQDDAELAQSLLQALLQRDEKLEHSGSALRLWRRQQWKGDWTGMQETAQLSLQRMGSAPGAWALMIESLRLQGQAEPALHAAFAAMERVGAAPQVLSAAMDVTLTLFEPSALPELWTLFAERLAGQAQTLSLLGFRWVNGGQESLLLPQLQLLAERHPHDVNVQYNLGRACLHLGQHEQAEPVLRRAVEMADTALWPRYYLARALLQREPAEALQVLAPVASSQPALCWFPMRQALMSLERGEEAERLLAELREIAQGVLELLDVLLDSGAGEHALTLLELAKGQPQQRSSFEQAQLDFALGRALARTERYAESLEALQRAYASQPSSAVGVLLMKVAISAQRPQVVLELAEQLLRDALRDSKLANDPWSVRGLWAAAAAAAGDLQREQDFLDAVGMHPDALGVWLWASQRLQRPDEQSRITRLTEAGPGILARLQRWYP
ncbi:MAG: hypothetical protein RBU37_15780 [Myxococcota bacterium]|jgi:hypothetical protein|nr:hypothetical protein [Myxococcota bacterium]